MRNLWAGWGSEAAAAGAPCAPPPSRPSWDLCCGSAPCPVTGACSSCSTWTSRSSSLRTGWAACTATAPAPPRSPPRAPSRPSPTRAPSAPPRPPRPAPRPLPPPCLPPPPLPRCWGLDMQQTPESIVGGSECLHVPSDTSPCSSPPCAPPPGPPTTNADGVVVNFDPDPADLALSSVPGQEAFDPRRHRFSEEELKPQPMIKKARKMLVPAEQKDDKYWNRRYKNNEAAKRSRDARRLKENQISVRAAFLERENAALRQEVADMRKELGRCRNILSKYESRHGDL
ncbi:hypothetical protein SKAU_G00400180 [Synaphobranchus kaupii]|uniref:BZIP domain-containing protein n=1 Tax=Synaphobranchus kaupii TaxID=118154 RepID=A0A9Q1IC92_SYNKA|nr:hypothetical protein SKAU_G00400180 [Synaphobranchus kaupii]